MRDELPAHDGDSDLSKLSFRGVRSTSPESITTSRGYGFRTCAQGRAIRNDGHSRKRLRPPHAHRSL
ncbi:hypothetical protein EI171_05605 [Bradyrhizobium sp. LCT2]|nr:hypothetical protein EI171_05605 [Bradyrhizobium sp. LCT2]